MGTPRSATLIDGAMKKRIFYVAIILFTSELYGQEFDCNDVVQYSKISERYHESTLNIYARINHVVDVVGRDSLLIGQSVLIYSHDSTSILSIYVQYDYNKCNQDNHFDYYIKKIMLFYKNLVRTTNYVALKGPGSVYEFEIDALYNTKEIDSSISLDFCISDSACYMVKIFHYYSEIDSSQTVPQITKSEPIGSLVDFLNKEAIQLRTRCLFSITRRN
ncbi:MAG: hypothetical protein ACK5U7_00995 [Bacteroidota bacterium]|jgi:hypothetical protein